MELKNKTKDDLIKMLNNKKEDLCNFRFGKSGSKAKDTKQGSDSRKEIARIMTKLSELKIAE